MRLAYRSLPQDVRDRFIAKVWRDANSYNYETGEYRNTASYPQAAPRSAGSDDCPWTPVTCPVTRPAPGAAHWSIVGFRCRPRRRWALFELKVRPERLAPAGRD